MVQVSTDNRRVWVGTIVARKVMSESGDLRMRHEVSKRRLQRAHDISFFAVIVLFFVPRAVFLLVSTMDRELWLKPKLRKSAQITDFRLSIHPQKFETITVIRGYKNGKLVRLCAVLVPFRALNPSRRQNGGSSGEENVIAFKSKGTIVARNRLHYKRSRF